ncbi:hypothetical protein [Haloarcula amylovorans]|uniref:hypothetical protein n=1 Tax=Haloarcula amylovorans TaxID=2562280 RepID=UPI001075F7E3|nr:hypothetical protein [Halomicroarcula amylolytica]
MPALASVAEGAVLQSTGGPEAIASAVLVFLVSLLVGAAAINLGAQIFIDRDTGFRRATVTALIGALVYTLVGFFLGWIPLLGPILMLLAWVAVINWQYPGGWATAAGIGLIAWLVAVLILFALAQVGFVTPEAMGVPGA